MRKSLGLALGAALVALAAGSAAAKTPDDTLVMADFIDDMISLDPAEAYEFSGLEALAQFYDRLITYPVNDVTDIQGLIAESWSVSDDGRTFTMKIRDGIKFQSGNPLSAADVAYSLQRVVALDKSPGFILTQFGFSKDNMKETIKAADPHTVVLKLDKPYAPTFILYCLSAGVGSVVDQKLVQEHETGGDYGYAWLKTHSAASGPFKLRAWKPNESWSAEANPDYWRGKPGFKRVVVRHVPETGTQRLLLEKGDIDIARKLTPEDITAVAKEDGIKIEKAPKGALWYMGLNQKNQYLAKPEVDQALRYLVNYQGIVDNILKGKALVHQTILPQGFLGAINDTPFSLNVAKAKDLLAKAGLPNGFKVTMDTRNNSPTKDIAQAVQQMFAQAGVQVEILPADNKQTLTKYRARTHDIYIGEWGPDYEDPHTNADGFVRNTDNSQEGHGGVLAWRNAWADPALNHQVEAAVLERDTKKRIADYERLQREMLTRGPYVIMAQQVEVIASRKDVHGMIWGPSFDDNKYWKGSKDR